MKKIETQLTDDTYEKLEIMAKSAKLTPNKLLSVLMEAFIQHGGKIFSGEWEEGPGLRLLPDWPRFSSGVIKIKQSEFEERS
jgi:hypothetical protein